jgi:glycerophosphoryl diester phosphodiesterase
MPRFINLFPHAFAFFNTGYSHMKSSWPYPKVFAHRGAGTAAPENTLAAMRVGHQMGYLAVEFDVMLTQDNVLCVMHDPQLGRTVAGKGSVSQMSYESLAKLDAGSWHSLAFAGEAVPTLDQVVHYCCAKRIAMNIEIKPAPGFAKQTGTAVAHALATYKSQYSALSEPHLHPLVSSFSVEALTQFRALAPSQNAGLLFSQTPANWFADVDRLACQAIHCQYRLLTKELVAQVKQRGFWLFCYTVNDLKDGERLLDWGVDGFCTDRLDLMASLLRD